MSSTTLRASGQRHATAAQRPSPPAAPTRALIDVVVPVYNEAHVLAASIRRLHEHLAALPIPSRIVIANNASTDHTADVARAPSPRDLPAWRARLSSPRRAAGARAARRLDRQPGRRALLHGRRPVDDLAALLPLVAPLLSGHSDLAIGTRLARNSRVERGLQRELISRTYNRILRYSLWRPVLRRPMRLQGDPCGCGPPALPQVRDEAWFFDTELLVLAAARRAPHPRGARGLGRRPRFARRRGADRRRRPQGHRATHRRHARPTFLAIRRRLHARLRPDLPAALRGRSPRRRQCRSTRDHGDRQHAGQPPPHVQGARRTADLGRHHLQGSLVFLLTLALSTGVLGAVHWAWVSPRGSSSSARSSARTSSRRSCATSPCATGCSPVSAAGRDRALSPCGSWPPPFAGDAPARTPERRPIPSYLSTTTPRSDVFSLHLPPHHHAPPSESAGAHATSDSRLRRLTAKVRPEARAARARRRVPEPLEPLRERQANTYYSAAVRSMSESWSAFLWGTFDSSGLMTVDKPPLSRSGSRRPRCGSSAGARGRTWCRRP